MHLMPTVENLLARLFESRGYQVALGQTIEGASGTQYRVPLVAKASKDTVLVWTSLDGSVTPADAEQLTSAVHDVGADLGVVAAMAGADPSAVAAAAHGRVEVWSRGRLALELGEMMLHGAGDAHPSLARADAPTPTPAAPAPLTVPVAKSQPRRFASLIQQAAAVSDPGSHAGAAMLMPSAPRRVETPAAPPGPLAYAWGGAPGAPTHHANAIALPGHATKQVDQWGNVVHPSAAPVAPTAARAAPAAPAAPAATLPPPPVPEVARPEAGQALAVKVEEARAVAAAQAAVGAPRGARLVLEPHIAFSWAWAGYVDPKKPPMTTKGVLLVNTVDGRMHEVGEPEWGAPPPGERPEGRITAVDVYDQVKGRLAKLTTRQVKVSREVAGEEVFEMKRVGPKSPDEMGLEHHGVVYCPVWVVQGERGEVRVDAFTGEVQSPAAAPAGAAPRPKDTGAEIL